MNHMQNVDIEREGAKAAAGFKTAAVVVVIGIIAAAGEAWQPQSQSLPPVDAMKSEFFSAPASTVEIAGTPYSPSAEAYRSMERSDHIEAF